MCQFRSAGPAVRNPGVGKNVVSSFSGKGDANKLAFQLANASVACPDTTGGGSTTDVGLGRVLSETCADITISLPCIATPGVLTDYPEAIPTTAPDNWFEWTWTFTLAPNGGVYETYVAGAPTVSAPVDLEAFPKKPEIVLGVDTLTVTFMLRDGRIYAPTEGWAAKGECWFEWYKKRSLDGFMIYYATLPDSYFYSLADVMVGYDPAVHTDWGLHFPVHLNKYLLLPVAPIGREKVALYNGDLGAIPTPIVQTYYTLPIVVDGKLVTRGGAFRENLIIVGSKGPVVELIRI